MNSVTHDGPLFIHRMDHSLSHTESLFFFVSPQAKNIHVYTRQCHDDNWLCVLCGNGKKHFHFEIRTVKSFMRESALQGIFRKKRKTSVRKILFRSLLSAESTLSVDLILWMNFITFVRVSRLPVSSLEIVLVQIKKNCDFPKIMLKWKISCWLLHDNANN